MCFDEPFQLYGDYNKDKTKWLALTFNFCDSAKRKTCKSKEQTEAYLGTKFISIIYSTK